MSRLLVFPALFAALPSPLSAQEEKPTNIIYIMTDDLGYGDLGCYGQEVVRTPNLDRMAAEGMRFTDHYAGHTVCRPSRLVLWTGKHVGHTGLIGNRSRSLTGSEKTLPRILQDAGYTTGGVGKWALGNVDEPAEVDNPGHPNHNGFDMWFGYLNQGNAHNFYPPFLWDNMEQFALSGNVLMTDNEKARGRVSEKRVTYSHDVMTERALSFVRENHEDPFLLHIHWTIPHANNEGGRVLGDGMEIPDYGIYADRDWPNPEKGFAAMVTRMDRDVGQLLDLLAELGIDERTAVFFTSDNGPHQEGEHKHEFFDSNGPLKGYKRSMHDGGIRVPLIVHWPGTVEAGTVSDHPSAFWDYLPTACEIAGAETPAGIDGISYLPTLEGRSENQEQHDYLYWASSEGETSVGIRDGKWKLVKYRGKKKSNAPESWRLYDLSQDIGEENDISSEHPEVVERITAKVRQDELAGFAEAAEKEKEITVALIGDSTVTDSAGWGAAFAARFGSNVEVTNFAAGGRSAKSWLAEDRLPAVLEAKPDYVLIQFGHNGQPGKGPKRETDPATTYREFLRGYVEEFRSVGATPILVSSVTRRDFDPNDKIRTSIDDAKAPGEKASWTFSPKENDITHFNPAGAEAIANLVVGELRKSVPELAERLR